MSSTASPQPVGVIRNNTTTTPPLILRESLLHGILLACIGIVGVQGARSGSPVMPSIAAATLIISLAVSLARFVGEFIYSRHRGHRQYITLGVNQEEEEVGEVEDFEEENASEAVDFATTTGSAAAAATAAASEAGARAAGRVYREATTLGFSSDDASAMSAIAFAVAEEATVNNRRFTLTNTNTSIQQSSGSELPLPAFPWIGVTPSATASAATASVTTLTTPPSQPTCTICFEPYRKGVLCRALICAHTYHDVCLRKWLSVKPICPECRTHVGVM